MLGLLHPRSYMQCNGAVLRWQARPRALGVAISKGLSTYTCHMIRLLRSTGTRTPRSILSSNLQKLCLEVTISQGPCHCQGHRGSTHGTKPGSLRP